MMSETWALVRRPGLSRTGRAPRAEVVWATLVAADLLGALLAAPLADAVVTSDTTGSSRTVVSVVPPALCLVVVLALVGAYTGRSAFQGRCTVAPSRVGQGLVLTGLGAWIL